MKKKIGPRSNNTYFSTYQRVKRKKKKPAEILRNEGKEQA